MSKKKTEANDTHLLIGNGFSIGIDKNFKYSALFEVANLTDAEKKLFGKSHDFERIILNLTTAQEIIRALDGESNTLIAIIQNHIDSIKSKLIKAIHTVHPTNLKSLLDEATIKKYIDTLEKFRSIYVLNYDLLLYWLLMERKNQDKASDIRWRDGFRGNPPPPHWPGNQGVNFFNLHGSLYFIKSPEFELEKLVWGSEDSILQKVDDKINSDTLPIYVCEGTSQEKIDHIFHSDYLGFAFEKLNKIEGELVLYGVSLDDNDMHIWESISKNNKIKKLFISFHEDQSPIEKKAQTIFSELYNNGKITFFSATLESLNATISSESH